MKRITANWLFITAGILLTAICVKIAYQQRGYIAVGGEWLIMPLMIAVRDMTKSVISFLGG